MRIHRRLAATIVALVLLALGSIAPYQAIAASDSTVTIALTATVETVEDPQNILGGAIQPGDTVTGTYTYNSAASDTNPSPNIGEYWHTTAPCGSIVTRTFSYTGAPQTWTVPAGVTEATFDIHGAQGGNGLFVGGGEGGEARAALAVTAGQVFQITVGGQGASVVLAVGAGGDGGDSGADSGGSGYGPAGVVFQSGVRTGNGLVIITYTLPDTTAPSASPARSPAPNAAGWNNGDVTVSWN
jgi:hypothetical protein